MNTLLGLCLVCSNFRLRRVRTAWFLLACLSFRNMLTGHAQRCLYLTSKPRGPPFRSLGEISGATEFKQQARKGAWICITIRSLVKKRIQRKGSRAVFFGRLLRTCALAGSRLLLRFFYGMRACSKHWRNIALGCTWYHHVLTASCVVDKNSWSAKKSELTKGITRDKPEGVFFFWSRFSRNSVKAWAEGWPKEKKVPLGQVTKIKHALRVCYEIKEKARNKAKKRERSALFSTACREKGKIGFLSLREG